MPLTPYPRRPPGRPRQGDRFTGALATRHAVFTQYNSLIVLAEGPIDLDLYELICAEVDRQGPDLQEVLIDLGEADPTSEAMDQALAALDKYASQSNVLVHIAAAGPDIRARSKAQCHCLDWIE